MRHRLKEYVKRRFDRRYGLASDVEELRQEVARLEARYGAAREVDPVDKNLDEVEERVDRHSPRSAALAPSTPGDHSIRLEVFRSILEPMNPGRLLDLAAGHGAFAKVASDMGWDVTAVDARVERFPEIEGIDWVQADLRDYEIGDFDVITMLGVFYHLELKDQLSVLKRCAGTMTIIDTHVALGAEVTEGGYEGRFFAERLEAATASWINETSFWPTEESLIRMLHESGYRFIFKLTPPPMIRDRTWYICH